MKIYVGNLPFSIEDGSLKKLFESYGEIEESVVIKNKFNNQSKGFGFVTLKDDGAAKKAIAEMNEKEVEGRKLVVNEAKPLDPDRPRPPRRTFNNNNNRSFNNNNNRRRY
jgi:RNA recognition motif-containing protein